MVIAEHYPGKNVEANNIMYKTYHLNIFPNLCMQFYNKSMEEEKGQTIQAQGDYNCTLKFSNIDIARCY